MDNPWKIASIILLVLLIISGIINLSGGFEGFGKSPLFSSQSTGTADAQIAIQYIRSNLLGQGDTIQLLNVTEESGVFRISTQYTSSQGQQNIDVFMTKDAKLLFPTSYSLGTGSNLVATPTQPAAKNCSDVSKQAAPLLEAFVVSYCPYGTQMQTILGTIVSKVPDLTSSIKVRYIGDISNGTIQSMHGPAEAAENLRQICVREEQPDLYWKYVTCFVNSRDTASCQASAGVNSSVLNMCTSDPSRGLKYAQEDFAFADAKGISASPTLVLNGNIVNEFDFGGRNPEAIKSLLCCGFNTQPAACNVTLNSGQTATSGNC